MLVVLLPALTKAQLGLPRIVDHGMVLQRDEPVSIWGWSKPGSEVQVKFNNKSYKTVTSPEGKWSLTLASTSKGGPFTMEITSKKESIQINDILIGDVWLCSGQSNMVHFFDRYRERYGEEIATSTNDQIRQFLVPTSTNLVGPQNELNGGEWKSANPKNLLEFSVIAYFFAKQINEVYDVPIGIINASVGGTPIEAWTSEQGFKDFPAIQETIVANKDTAKVFAQNKEANEVRQAWYSRPTADKGLLSDPKWFDPEYKASEWKRISVPGYWEDQGIRDLDGVVWYRKEFSIPATKAGESGKVYLGRIVDADEVYINGQQIGRTTYQYPPRRYEIPSGLLQTGRNTITVRVTNQGGKGGFVPDKDYYIEASGHQVDLTGYWEYNVGEVFEKLDFPPSISLQNQPTALYNAMVAPYTNYSIKGVVWYQGESNSWKPQEYYDLLPAFVNDWRSQWNDINLPFIVIQLPNFMEVNYSPEESSWARMREAQSEVLAMENTGLVVTIDLGDWNDIHPENKKPVGQRVALVARNVAYGEQDLVYSGPICKSAKVKEGKVVLNFDQVGGGLISGNDEPLAHFAIAGADKQFVWAEAIIKDDQVIVWNDDIAQPKFVRYAWADNPDFANLYNSEGLPAAPFEIGLEPD
ncbi:MAG: sialate O-acetylesterase [Marinoscillum sp.]